MIRKLLKLAVFLLVANALYQLAPVSLRYFQFKDAVRELALFPQKLNESQLVDKVMEMAEEHSVPLERDDVQVRREPDGSVLIDLSYVETLRFVPGFEYSWQFNVIARPY
jgi:ABC-type enterochelin transport system substrate-binding protein